MKSLLLIVMLATKFYSTSLLAEHPDPIIVDTNLFQDGLLMKLPVNELPLFILNRRDQEVENLIEIHKDKVEPVTNCPKCNTILRSISENILVIWGFNPSTGCELYYASSKENNFTEYGLVDRGGFVDSCNDAVFDLTGRKLFGPKSTPETLEVPTYKIVDGVVEINRNIYPEHLTNNQI